MDISFLNFDARNFLSHSNKIVNVLFLTRYSYFVVKTSVELHAHCHYPATIADATAFATAADATTLVTIAGAPEIPFRSP